METKTLLIHLPADLAAQAEQAGLLEDDKLVDLLAKELTRLERINRFFEDIDRLAAIQPPLTPEEIEAEIAAARAESDK